MRAKGAVDASEFEKLDVEMAVVIDYDDRPEVTVPLWRLAK